MFIRTLLHVEMSLLLSHSFLLLWPMSFKQYCKSWGANPAAWVVSWSITYIRCWEASQHMPRSVNIRGTLQTLGIWVFDYHSLQYLCSLPGSELLSEQSWHLGIWAIILLCHFLLIMEHAATLFRVWKSRSRLPCFRFSDTPFLQLHIQMVLAASQRDSQVKGW